MQVPVEVSNLIDTITQSQIWFNISNNVNDQEAWSCRDAASKRMRLGSPGIPIFCELKSAFGYIKQDNKKQYIIIHCRGNQRLDYTKINEILYSEFQKTIDEDELVDLNDSRYGLVNPFSGYGHPEILQLFDESIISMKHIPQTMMTNASHRKWSIEFRPDELIDKLPNTNVVDIIVANTKFHLPNHKIGILTGNSPESGILLWELINTRIRTNLGKNHFLGDISLPEVVIESSPKMGLSMELDLRYNEVKETVTQGITNLCERGATICCIACNTTQFFSEECENICAKYNAKYVAMPDTVHQYLTKNQIKELDFLGIKYVIDFDKWSSFKQLNNDFCLNVPPPDAIDKINELAFEVKRNVESGRGKNLLRDLINNSTKTQIILIALTELSILFKTERSRKGKSFIDTLSILADYIGDLFTEDYKNAID